jgi:hypothetical protein
VNRYEPREIDGRWAIYDTVEDRVTGWFGRGEDEGLSAASNASQMNLAAASRADEDELGFHAALARGEALAHAPKRPGE